MAVGASANELDAGFLLVLEKLCRSLQKGSFLRLSSSQ
jgi:hypothetical protein